MRQSFLPFALPDTDQTEIEAVAEAIRSGWITTGPQTRRFEADFAAAVGARHGVAVNSCTAAMHLAMEAIGLQAGDAVITTPYTFAATAEVIRYFNATPVFVDVEPDTLNIDATRLAETIDSMTNDQLPMINDQLPMINDQLPMINDQLPMINDQLSMTSSPFATPAPRPNGRAGTSARHSSLVTRHSSLVKAIIPVHIAGLPADLDAIAAIAARHRLTVIEDAAHAFPAAYKGRMIGSALRGQGAEISSQNSQPATRNPPNSTLNTQNSKFTIPHAVCYSFYATKTITTGEGGMLCTDNEALAERCRVMALHGISKDAWKRYTAEGSWYYEIVAPGFKYNMTDIAAAMGLAQLAKAERMWQRRREIAARYTEAFAQLPELQPPPDRADCRHAWHLYLLRLHLERLTLDRAAFIEQLKARNIGSSVHFIPLHLHPYYRQTYGYQPQDFPVAFREYQRVISLPIYSKMSDDDVQDVIDAVRAVVARQRVRVFAAGH